MDKLEEKIMKIKERFSEIEQKMINVNHTTAEYKSLVKEYQRLKPLSDKIESYLKTKEKIKELEEIMDDKELKELAIEEVKKMRKKFDDLEKEIKSDILFATDPLASRNVILEIRAGAGGEEAALFAADLLKMYLRFAERKKWVAEIMSAHMTDLRGFKEVTVAIQGKNVYSYLKYESGVHRVQRIPLTESSGRIHTSTASVAVLPEPEEIEIKLSENDLKIETFRSSGPGGQHMQKTESAVRVRHLPSGITICCQDARSQLKNKEKALRILKAKLYELEERKRKEMTTRERREQIGSAERSEKIRTYNFPQNRVTDHRINLTLYDLPNILEGELDEIIERLAISYEGS